MRSTDVHVGSPLSVDNIYWCTATNLNQICINLITLIIFLVLDIELYLHQNSIIVPALNFLQAYRNIQSK